MIRVLPIVMWAMFGAAVVAADEPITPAEAAKKVGEQVTVAMEVQSSRTQNGLCFLNSAADFRAADNLTLFLNGAALTKFKAAGVEDPATHFRGKKVLASGKVTLFRERPQIAITGPDDLKPADK